MIKIAKWLRKTKSSFLRVCVLDRDRFVRTREICSQQLCRKIRVYWPNLVTPNESPIDDEDGWVEGKPAYREHLIIRRSPKKM
ncbi:hypothetical protein PsorP6_000105 [Peronosclerospora sorghi]|uniref:Uncharacterized protein n=1 Tax=Peronosclerospora sorghi TaxID=230839 RepID=A0ACC0WWQ5_9STRA|nr:hypothetical protein PsorP6_000105 [Peronosclerospora sorghi]